MQRRWMPFLQIERPSSVQQYVAPLLHICIKKEQEKLHLIQLRDRPKRILIKRYTKKKKKQKIYETLCQLLFIRPTHPHVFSVGSKPTTLDELDELY